MSTVIGGIVRRELSAYFSTPIAWVFLIIFVFMTALMTFTLGDLFGRGQADLGPFFSLLPWLFMFFLPAVSMRLWAEERQTGNIELLLTLPVPPATIVIGKFLAAWAFVALALALTFPLWLTINYLGEPDNGKVLAAYLASWLMAGAMLAAGSLVSASTRNQVVAFVVTVFLLFLLLWPGMTAAELESSTSGFARFFTELASAVSFLSHFRRLADGIVNVADGLYFVGTIAIFLVATGLMLEWKKTHAL